MSASEVITSGPPPDEEPAAVATSDTRRDRSLLGWSFVIGMILVLGPLLAALIGRFMVDPEGLRIASGLPSSPPSAENLLGTDTTGRDVLALLVHGTPPTYLVGAVSGLLGTAIGTFVGLIGGYVRGITDTLVRGSIDVALGIPGLAVAIVLAALFGEVTPLQLGILIAAFLWAYPARQIRSQVLSLREHQFVFIAKLSNERPLRIMFGEILPNILPFVVAGFVAAVSFGILVAVGLQLLGIGSSQPTLGLILQLSITGGGLSRGMWWWWAPPSIVLSVLFIGLFLVSTAVDRFANPRLAGTR